MVFARCHIVFEWWILFFSYKELVTAIGKKDFNILKTALKKIVEDDGTIDELDREGTENMFFKIILRKPLDRESFEKVKNVSALILESCAQQWITF